MEVTLLSDSQSVQLASATYRPLGCPFPVMGGEGRKTRCRNVREGAGGRGEARAVGPRTVVESKLTRDRSVRTRRAGLRDTALQQGGEGTGVPPGPEAPIDDRPWPEPPDHGLELIRLPLGVPAVLAFRQERLDQFSPAFRELPACDDRLPAGPAFPADPVRQAVRTARRDNWCPVAGLPGR
jgi:hypothetical protein